MQAALDAVWLSHVEPFFVGNSAKAQKADGSASNASGGRKHEADPSDSTKEFIKAVSRASATAVAGVCDQRMDTMQEATVACNTRVTVLEDQCRVEMARMGNDLVVLRTRMEAVAAIAPTQAASSEIDLQTLRNEMQTQITTLQSSAGTNRGDPNADNPYEQRRIFRMGGLGWDTDAATLVARAKDVLQRANVEARGLVALCQAGGTGSAVQGCCPDGEEVRVGRLAVAELQIKFENCRGVAWMDAQKTRKELRPARIIHRLFDTMCFHEDEKKVGDPQPKIKFSKDLGAKRIECAGVHYAWSLRGHVLWADAAKSRYSEAKLAYFVEYAEGD